MGKRRARRADPRVRSRPLVAIMSTGDEVVPADTAELRPGDVEIVRVH